MHPKPLVHERFWAFVRLNEIDMVDMIKYGEGDQYVIYARKWMSTPGRRWDNKKIIFKSKVPMLLEEAMEEICAGVKTPDIYFRKNHPIRTL